MGGWISFWAGAATPPWRWWSPIPVREYLELVAANRGIWLWIAASFALGVLLTLAGLEPSDLPVAGVETARKVADPSLPSNQLMRTADIRRERPFP